MIFAANFISKKISTENWKNIFSDFIYEINQNFFFNLLIRLKKDNSFLILANSWPTCLKITTKKDFLKSTSKKIRFCDFVCQETI